MSRLFRRATSPAAFLAALLATSTAGAWAQSVALTGTMGDRALLVIDGGSPIVVGRGETRSGVTLLSVDADVASVEVNGRRQRLRVGDVPVNLGTGHNAANGTRIVMSAGSGGHFMSTGQINGVSVRFLVDTGASSVALSAAEAQRIGIDLRAGKPGLSNTANGVTPALQIRLDSIRIGDVEIYGVDAMIVPATLPYVLLGNTFLTHFQIRQENTLLTLEKRY